MESLRDFLSTFAMMTESGSATIVKRGANENRFNMAANIIGGTLGKQQSANGDDAGVKAIRNFRLSALPLGPCALETQVFAF